MNKEEYQQFTKNNPYRTHFLQSFEWGELSKYKGLKPHYIGLKKDNEIVASSLLLQKKLPFGYSYFYAPRGFICDYNNYDVVKYFTQELYKYIKKSKGLFLKMDPDIELHNIDNKAQPINDSVNNYLLVEELKKMGYKHKGYNKFFEGSQPRYTFRIDIDKDWSLIENSFSSTSRQLIKKAHEYGVETTIGKREDIEIFFNLMQLTEKRKNIYQHSKDYYYKLYDIFAEDNKIKLFLAKIYFDKIISNLKEKEQSNNEELIKINDEINANSNKNLVNKMQELIKSNEKIHKTIEKFSEYYLLYPDGVYASAHIVVFHGDKAWNLYAGNNNDFSDAYANYLLYECHIKYAHDNGYKIYDQFGTIGDLKADSRLIGLHEFKRKFGGRYIEFIGEFDLIINKLLYYLFIYLIPVYRKIIRALLKRKRGNDNDI